MQFKGRMIHQHPVEIRSMPGPNTGFVLPFVKEFLKNNPQPIIAMFNGNYEERMHLKEVKCSLKDKGIRCLTERVWTEMYTIGGNCSPKMFESK